MRCGFEPSQPHSNQLLLIFYLKPLNDHIDLTTCNKLIKTCCLHVYSDNIRLGKDHEDKYDIYTNTFFDVLLLNPGRIYKWLYTIRK